ncbi:hypothetical protein T484DRAFT_1842881 [Baffinella frigidus]|nr:hypothetical protein T484DRAFT_1842881 [Cryptophyta sp. CCMP2293]
MHVSPFMDMNRCWRLEASQPADLANKPPSLSAAVFKLRGDVSLSVTTVPNCPGGSEFVARVAIRIYWHALKLVAKGVR